MIATTPRPPQQFPSGYHHSAVHARVHRAATPPSSPAQSDDIAILRAWMDAEQRSTAPGCRQPEVDEQGHQWRCGRCPACEAYQRTVGAAVESAVRRCKDRRAGRVGTHYEAIPTDIRPLVGRRDGEGMKAIVGRWERDGAFVVGMAGLSESEAKVYWWDLRGWALEEIQRELTKDRLGSGKAMRAMWEGDRTRWVPVDDIMRDLESARGKVARVFGL